MKKMFDELVIFARTGLNPRTNFKLGQGTNKYITIKNIRNNRIVIDENTDVVDDEAIKLIHRRSQIKKGDILFASIGRMGDMYIIEEEPKNWDINESVFAFTVDTNIIRQKYFYYIFKNCTTLNYLASNSSGSTFKSIKMNQLKKMVFEIPTLQKQDEIVNILDKVNEVIENCMAQIQLLDVLIKSRFVEMFGEPGINPLGWKTTTLGNECYYGPHKSLSDIGKGNGGYPFISVRNIVNGYIDFTTAKYISDEDYQSAIKKCHPEKGDILYSKGGTTGIAKLVDVDVKFANWVHLAVLKFDKSVLNGVFLENMLNCDYCYTQSQKLTKGIANRDLVLSAMAQIKIYKPPIELQNEFAAFVHQVDKLKSTTQKSLDKTRQLFDSLMQKYFE